MAEFSRIVAIHVCWVLFNVYWVSCVSIQEQQPQFVQLHKQRVPVQSAEGLVSFKSVYFGHILLGSPFRQKFSMVFDTGSGHVVVPSSTCESATCAMHQRYDASLSAVSSQVDQDGRAVKPGEPRDQLVVAYGTGEVAGSFVVERVCLDIVNKTQVGSFAATEDVASIAASVPDGDVVSPEATSEQGCASLHLVAATEMSPDPFGWFSFDGIVGLSFSELALSPSFSFFLKLSEQKKSGLPSKIFGVFLADDTDDFSEICFGGLNMARVVSPVNWTSVAFADLGHWQVRVLSMSVGNRTLDFCADGECRAVVDTGTSSLAAPVGVAGHLQDMLEKGLTSKAANVRGGETSCHAASGDIIRFELEDSITIELAASDYARASVALPGTDSSEFSDTDAEAAILALDGTLPGDGDAISPECRPALVAIDLPVPLGPKMFIWGEPVLRKYYTAFDIDKRRVGFALAKHGTGHEVEDDDIQHTDEEHWETSRRPLLV
eukprot:TRINITY_DN60749_c0_g1_i1.p1 TRINITY_DN60749_c0_g1~~TRINITY_DN60749_c0_g1_i1.p1  ORF type:complete len:492 (-),score=73.82 TRINITY_DN60749_c0_g1_i1:159-1634(-)